jgi:hypothetical protein
MKNVLATAGLVKINLAMLQTSILIADENEVQHTSSVRADGIKIKDEVENDRSMMFDIEEDQAQPEYKGSNELLMQQMSPLQRQLHLIFVQPRTLPAKVFIHTCSFFILVYTMMALFETMPQYNMSDGRSYLSDYL